MANNNIVTIGNDEFFYLYLKTSIGFDLSIGYKLIAEVPKN